MTAVTACPHCGAAPGEGDFCAACGNRVRSRVLSPTARTLLQVGIVLVAIPLLLLGGVLSLCGGIGLLGSVFNLDFDVMFFAAIWLGLGLGLGKLALVMLRRSRERLEGDAEVGFGDEES